MRRSRHVTLGALACVLTAAGARAQTSVESAPASTDASGSTDASAPSEPSAAPAATPRVLLGDKPLDPTAKPGSPRKPRKGVPVPAIDATPAYAPFVPYRPGRQLPLLTTYHRPKAEPNTVDGKVWTQTLYSVSQPLGVEWGYGQVGAQLDVDNLFGTPVGAHLDGFFQQRMYHRPLRLGVRTGFLAFADDPIPVDGTAHARYLTYDRLTEANLAMRHRFFDVKVGRSIVPQAMQAFVDGVQASASPLPWLRLGGFGGLMPDIWHPRMWLDADYRSVDNFLPSTREDTPTLDPLTSDAARFSARPAKLVDSLLNGQTVFNLHSFTAGGFLSFRFNKFTSDTSTQLILWNPTLGYRSADNLVGPKRSELGLVRPTETLFTMVDAAYVNQVFTWRPVAPLNFRMQGSWDAWGANRALDARRVSKDGNIAKALSQPVQYLDPLVDSSFGLREVLMDATFRGDLPVGLNVQFHHYQSQVTASSYGYYQRDLLQPSVAGAMADGEANNPGVKPKPRQAFLMGPKVINNQKLGTVQRERLRASGWVRPWGFINAQSASAQLYAETYLEWRRDYPKPRPETRVACTRDLVTQRDGTTTSGGDLKPENYDTRKSCGSTNSAPQDDYLRVAGTVGLRDPTLYDNLTYDFSVTAMDSWHNRAVVARSRVGAQAYDHLFVDLGFTYELSLNHRYFTSTVPYDPSGVRVAGLPYYPDTAVGQSVVLDATAMYRVAMGLTFDASYLLFFEEEPVVQDYILGNGDAPSGIRGYIPRDTFQAQQLFLLRAVYRL